MGNMKVSQGKCEQCGEDGKSLRLVFKKSVCSRCEAVRRAAYNAPGLLVSSVVEAKGQEWLAGLLKMTDIPPANVLDLEGVIAAKDMELEALHDEISDLGEKNISLVKTAMGLTEENRTLSKEIELFKGEIVNLKTRIADLLEQNKNLEQERFNLSVQVEKLTASPVVEAEDNLAKAGKNLFFAGAVPFDPDNDAQLAIACACEELCAMLIKKNQSYGNSALDPLRLFSKASAREQLLVRIDDKLSRVECGGEFPGDDTIVDLAGYLVLLLAHDRWRS
jgi:hypothetical protein